MLQGAEQVMRSVFDNSGPCCVCACQTRGDTFSDATPIVIAASAGPPPAALPALVKAESKVVPLGHYVFTLTLLNNHELRINASSHSGFHASKVIALPEEPKQEEHHCGDSTQHELRTQHSAVVTLTHHDSVIDETTSDAKCDEVPYVQQTKNQAIDKAKQEEEEEDHEKKVEKTNNPRREWGCSSFKKRSRLSRSSDAVVVAENHEASRKQLEKKRRKESSSQNDNHSRTRQLQPQQALVTMDHYKNKMKQMGFLSESFSLNNPLFAKEEDENDASRTARRITHHNHPRPTHNHEKGRGHILILDLPVEIQEHIFIFLPIKTLAGIMNRVCRQWKALADDPMLWSSIFHLRFGSTPFLEMDWKKRCVYTDEKAKALERKESAHHGLWWAARQGFCNYFRHLTLTDTRIRPYDRNTALVLASRRGHKDIVELLLGDPNTVDVDTEDGYGRTPLIRAAKNRHRDIVELLLKHNAEVNVMDIVDGTALMYAAANGDKLMVKLLLEHNADARCKNRHGHTAVDLARHNGHNHVIAILEKHLAALNQST